jgi:hypothetical protein
LLIASSAESRTQLRQSNVVSNKSLGTDSAEIVSQASRYRLDYTATPFDVEARVQLTSGLITHKVFSLDSSQSRSETSDVSLVVNWSSAIDSGEAAAECGGLKLILTLTPHSAEVEPQAEDASLAAMFAAAIDDAQSLSQCEDLGIAATANAESIEVDFECSQVSLAVNPLRMVGSESRSECLRTGVFYTEWRTADGKWHELFLRGEYIIGK